MTKPAADVDEPLTTDDLEDLGLFTEFVTTRRRSTRNQLVERHMGLAAHIAQRFARAGRADDDLRQVAMIGLVKAVDRFDPEYGVKFSSFAGRTIEGELKRHFRDASWAVKVPRRAKELHLLVRNAITHIEATGAPSPTVAELARHLGIDRDEVLRGLAATTAAAVGTIDAGAGDGDGPTDRQAALAADDRSFEDAENTHMVSKLLEGLDERERKIIEMRFYDDMSQSEIAEEIGVSQMHVSRLLKRSFEQMRALADGDAESDIVTT